jgi:hypothetical protein
MLNYAPGGRADCGQALCGQGWSVAWEAGRLAEDSQIYGLIAAVRESVIRTGISRQSSGKKPCNDFQPERMSGLCAAG